MTESLRVPLEDGTSVGGLLQLPARLLACCVLAHGAGAGMAHPFMAAIAEALAERRIATLRYQFVYSERGSKRPDAPALAQAVVRAAVGHAAVRLPALPLFAGGKSFGGRMTSQAQAAAPLPGIRGLLFIGFPLHPAGKPASERADHLSAVDLPMLFLQGSRDELAELPRITTVADRLGPHARLRVIDAADHAFHVPRRSGRSDAEVISELADAAAGWMTMIAGAEA